MSDKAYLTRYFSERNLNPDRIITVEHTGVDETMQTVHFSHMISVGEIIRMSIEVAPANEQAQIAQMIRKIEFMAPSSIHGFIDHLAKAFVMNYNLGI
jgi:folate-dependent phosphoribosylglycinamide formyltransferase PurN